MTTSHLTGNEMRLWANLRLVVIDCETIQAPNNKNRIVDLAAFTYKDSLLVDQWNQLINPERPVDPHTAAIHKLTDEVLSTKPTFADVADEFISLLEPEDDETVVIVVHHAAWDIGILHGELERVGLTLPLTPVLDTYGGLANFLGVHPERRSLAALCTTLEMPYAELHQAAADAKSLGLVIVELLKRAAAAGHTDIQELLNAHHVGTYTDRFKANPGHISRTTRNTGEAIPEEHFATHNMTLTEMSAVDVISDWVANIADCARYRCDTLFHAEAHALPSQELYEQLVATGDSLIDEAKRASGPTPVDQSNPPSKPATATIASYLGVATPLMVASITEQPQATTARTQVRQLFDRWGPTIKRLQRCDDPHDPCVYCASGYACPLDTWIYEIGAAYAGPGRWSNHFYPAKEYVRKHSAGYHIYLTRPNLRAKYIELLDAAVSAVIDWHLAQDDVYAANRIASAAWEEGCRNPQVAARFAHQVAAPGQPEQIETAIGICDEVLQHDNGSTAPVWVDLRNVRSRMVGLRNAANHRPKPTQIRNPRVHRRRFGFTVSPEERTEG